MRGDAQAIVILAGGMSRGAVEWGGDTINLFTLQRVRYGAWLAKRSGLPLLITGAAPDEGRPGEAEMMRDVLRDEFGVPVRWFDDQARTTAGNAREAAALLRAAGVERILLVTNAFHMPRAQRVFERTGLQVIAAPTGYFGYAGGAFEWSSPGAQRRCAAHFVPGAARDGRRVAVPRGRSSLSEGSAHGQRHAPRRRRKHRVDLLAHGRIQRQRRGVEVLAQPHRVGTTSESPSRPARPATAPAPAATASRRRWPPGA